MPIENIPEIYFQNKDTPGHFIYDFKMTSDVVKAKSFEHEYV
jgi:hypothetical protein